MFTKLHRSQINFNVKGLYGPKEGLVEDERYITFLFIYIISIYIYFKILSLLLLSRDRTLFALDMTFFHCKISRFRLGQNIS